MKSRALIIPVVIVLSLIVIVPYALNPASAHVTKTAGDLSIKVGFANEPPLVGDANTVQIFVDQGTGNNTQPIADTALDKMTMDIQYGGKTKTLSFDPSDDTPGEYDAAITPDQLGSYNIIMKGTINGQNVDLTFPLTEVESKDKYYFPPQSSSGTVTNGTTVQSVGTVGNNAGPQIGGNVLTQLTRDINDAKDTANSAAASYAKVAQSFQDVKNTTDTLYVISMVGIGVGGAGVLIAVIALTRKNHM